MYSRTTVDHTVVAPDAKTLFLLQSCRCGTCLLFGGGGFTLMGIIMTSVAYNQSSKFPMDSGDPLKIIGPIILSFGLLAVISAIVIIIIGCSKTNFSSSALMQANLLHQNTVIQQSASNTGLLSANRYMPRPPSQMNTMPPNPPYPAYSDPPYPNPPYPNPPYPNPSYPNPSYPDPSYPNPSYQTSDLPPPYEKHM